MSQLWERRVKVTTWAGRWTEDQAVTSGPTLGDTGSSSPEGAESAAQKRSSGWMKSLFTHRALRMLEALSEIHRKIDFAILLNLKR